MRELYRYTFELEELATTYPPKFTNPNKQAFYNKVVNGEPTAGKVEVTRWAATDLPPRRSSHRPRLTVRPGYFTYDSPDTGTTRHWHINFANYDLFSFYAGSLLAQDEMQVLEHPDLASVRIALIAKGASTLVTDAGGTWAGASEAVRHRFGAVAVWRGEGEGPGNARLADLGAKPLGNIGELQSALVADDPEPVQMSLIE